MKLLYTITSYPPAIGGAQIYFHHLARACAQTHDVQVVTHWDCNRVDWLMGITLRAPSLPHRYVIDDVPVYQLGFDLRAKLKALPGVIAYPIDQRRAVAWLSTEVQRQLLEIASDVDLVHNNRIGREPLSFASLKLARTLGVPFILTPNHHPRWVGWRYRTYIDLYRQADALIALTEVERDTFIQLGVDPERVHIVGAPGFLAERPNGQAFRRQHDIKGPMVLFVGQKYSYKGFDLLLQATARVWSEHPETTFVFIGPRTSYSRNLFAGYADRRIIELGAISLEEKTNALAACDVFCMPSAQESFGHVFVEAWMLGKPVIAADIPAERDVVSDGIDGILVQRHPRCIADQIMLLLDSTALRERLGQAGKSKAATKYSLEQIVERTLNVYQTVLSAPRRQRSTSYYILEG